MKEQHLLYVHPWTKVLQCIRDDVSDVNKRNIDHFMTEIRFKDYTTNQKNVFDYFSAGLMP